MAKVVIFGTEDLAELAHYYLTNDTEHEVVAFSVHEKYISESRKFCGLPVFEFERIEEEFSPNDFRFFAPMSSKKMNKHRESVFHDIKQKGYEFISYVSTKATVCDNTIGENCFILEDNTLQPFTTIGNNVVLWSGNHIGHHGKIDDHTFITSHVVMSGHVHIKENSFIGVNATIRDGVTIAEGSFVAMASVVVKDTLPWSVIKPAKSIVTSLSSRKLG